MDSHWLMEFLALIFYVFFWSLKQWSNLCYSLYNTDTKNDDNFDNALQVNVSELGLVTQGGKVVWGKWLL